MEYPNKLSVTLSREETWYLTCKWGVGFFVDTVGKRPRVGRSASYDFIRKMERCMPVRVLKCLFDVPFTYVHQWS